MKKLPGVATFKNSVQLKFALTFLVLIAGLMAMLNTYPTIVSRDLVFNAKQVSLQNQASVMSFALSTLDDLTHDTVYEVMELLDIRSLTRVIVTDDSAKILYDTSILDPSVGRYAMLSEVNRALNGEIICYSIYDGKAFMTYEAMPIRSGGKTIGSVYLYEYDSSQAELITNIQKNLRNITLVLGVSAVILMSIFSRALTLRITDLVKATRIVSEGNYDYQIQTGGNDELSELGREFNTLTQRLKNTEELRRRFVSDASHELKTPLASIRLLSDSILNAEDMDIETMRDFVSDIENEAERLQRTTEKLLSLSKMDSNITLANEKIDICYVAKKTMHLLMPLANEYQVTLSTKLEQDCFIYGNEDLIYRIIFNLSENAIKYNMPGGKVEMLIYREGESVKLIVEDTGIGIPDDDAPHIFSRFYRVDKARSRDAGGSGLGLSIVYDAVRLHEGTVYFEKREGGGSRFVVNFPASPDQIEGEKTN